MSTSTSRYHHGDLAAALEDAAIELLSEVSVSALSLRAVARRAGVSHNAPYHHFRDRRGLLVAVARRSLEDLHAEMTHARSSGSTPHDQLLRIGQAYVNFAVTHPGQFQAIFDPEICDPHSPDPATEPLINANNELLRSSVAAALPAAASDEDIDACANAIWAAVHGLATLVVAGHLSHETVAPSLEALLSTRI